MSSPFDPLADSARRFREVVENATPPDARGAADEVADLERLRRTGERGLLVQVVLAADDELARRRRKAPGDAPAGRSVPRDGKPLSARLDDAEEALTSARTQREVRERASVVRDEITGERER